MTKPTHPIFARQSPPPQPVVVRKSKRRVPSYRALAQALAEVVACQGAYTPPQGVRTVSVGLPVVRTEERPSVACRPNGEVSAIQGTLEGGVV